MTNLTIQFNKWSRSYTNVNASLLKLIDLLNLVELLLCAHKSVKQLLTDATFGCRLQRHIRCQSIASPSSLASGQTTRCVNICNDKFNCLLDSKLCKHFDYRFNGVHSSSLASSLLWFSDVVDGIQKVKSESQNNPAHHRLLPPFNIASLWKLKFDQLAASHRRWKKSIEVSKTMIDVFFARYHSAIDKMWLIGSSSIFTRRMIMMMTRRSQFLKDFPPSQITFSSFFTEVFIVFFLATAWVSSLLPK